MDGNEPGDLVLTTFTKLIDRIKSSQPVRTDGKSLTLGFVYSQMPLGMPVDPNEYKNPWSPMGGSSLAESVGATSQSTGWSGTPTASGSGAQPKGGQSSGSGSTATVKAKGALDAAFKVSELVDNMLMVSKDNKYLEYPTTRHVSFAYEGVIKGMQPLPTPPLPDDIQKQITEAQSVLYKLDADGSITGKSDLYKKYVKNSTDYAKAKKDYNDAQAKALADPTLADAWPMDSVYYQNQVDQAWDTWKTEGAEKVERALDIIESVGVSVQDAMIAKARKVYDAWNLGLAGVATTIPYSYVSPTNWCDPDSDDDGWEKLTVTHDDYHSHTQSSDRSGSAGVSGVFGIVNLGAAGSYDSKSSSFHNDSTDLSIELEYALMTINRPWLIGDLFYLNNWYLVGNSKSSISDGTIDGQDNNIKPLMPMIPMQFLCVRNVKIKADHWNSDGDSISNTLSGGGGFGWGPLNFGATYSQTNTQSDYGWTYDGQTLSIHGVQIIAWLSEIVPPSAPIDDPNLKKT